MSSSSNKSGMMSVQTSGNEVETMNTECFARTPQMHTNVTTVMASGNVTETNAPTAGASNEASSSDVNSQDLAGGASCTTMAATSDLDLLLVGKSGVGKSATGNSILGKKVFKSSASLNSETNKISFDISKIKDQIIKVVDGPGVGDTRMDTDEGIRLFVESMEHAMITNPAGYHAFLLVIRFGTRFTQEDIDTITLLKKVFGPNFVKNYCILVVTCGDMFKYEAEENDIDFEQWVHQQAGAMAELVKECQNRVILFDNVTKKQEEKAAQIDKLLEHIGTLKNNGKRYTDANFQCALEARNKVIAESKIPIARDETLQAITLLMQELGEIRGRGAESEDIEATTVIVQDLEKLSKNAAVLMQDVIEQDRGTGALKDLIQSVETVNNSIISSMKLHRMALESRQKQKQSETEVSSRLKELETKIESTTEEDMKRKLMEENKMLKHELLKMEEERQEERLMFEQNQREAWTNVEHSQRMIYYHQQQRESTIFDGLKIIFEVVARPVKQLWKILKRF